MGMQYLPTIINNFVSQFFFDTSKNASLKKTSIGKMGIVLLAAVLLSQGACQPITADLNKAIARVNGDKLYSSKTASAFKTHCDTSVTSFRKTLKQLENKPKDNAGQESYLNRLDNFYIDLENSYNASQLYNSVHPDTDMRNSAGDCQQAIESIFTDISLSKGIYQQLEQLDIAHADAATKRFVQKLLKGFIRSGVDKSDELREQVRQLNTEIADLGQQFAKSIREDVRQIQITDKSDLNGLPQDYIDSLAKTDSGQWIITTDYPSVYPYLQYAESDSKRLAIYQQFLDRGYPANETVLNAIISKRDQLAKLLGYPSYAAYVTEEAMIKTETNAADFIDRIATMAKPRAEKDYAQLLAQLKRYQPQATKVGNWQKAYLEQQVKKSNYQYDAKEVREYFAYNQVKKGIFGLAEKLFDVEILSWESEVWHDSVSTHELRSKSSGKTLGYFYLDMHPREGKYKHAAHFGIKPGVAGKQLPVSALICNFPGANVALDESGQRVNRGLMEHNQVETFLHEFGHLMHGLIGGHQAWSGLSGIATERDFVEAPSQLLEEWVWDYETLKTFAVNSAGATIPKPLVDKMRAARNFGKGTHIRNQMFYAALSLQYYSTPPEQLDLNETLVRLQAEYSPFDYIDGTHFYANFGHLYGYSARYYTYMWSLVIAADMFAEFERDGLLNETVAHRYRDKVLAPGGSADAADLVEDFLGRPFNYDAFIHQLNAE